jgi:hypothetical protein
MTAAGAEEQTELQVLHDRAAETGRELTGTVTALADKLTEAASPQRWARRKAAGAAARTGRKAAGAAARARRAARRAPTLPARVGRPGLALTAGVFVLVAVAVTWQHRRRA